MKLIVFTAVLSFLFISVVLDHAHLVKFQYDTVQFLLDVTFGMSVMFIPDLISWLNKYFNLIQP